MSTNSSAVEIVRVFVEVAADLVDYVYEKLFSEAAAKMILSRMPNPEILSVYISFDSDSLLRKGVVRTSKIAEMESNGYRYLKKRPNG